MSSRGGRASNGHGLRWVLWASWVALILPQACGNSPREFSNAGGAAGESAGAGAAAGKSGSGGYHAGGSGGYSGDPVSGAGEGGLGGATSPDGDGGEAGTATQPQPENCPDLTDPANGVIDTRDTSAGTKATYSCNTGYKLSGTAARTCENKAWSGTAPTCALQDCGALTAPADGSVAAPTTTYGATATYACKQGYGPSGSSTRTCQADGKWSGTTPTCVIANCPALPGPTSGTVDAPVLTYGATATYSCNTGYTLSGSAARTCGTDGTWSGSAPTCAAKDCGALTAPTNGTISQPSTVVGATATYGCNAGYALSGNATRQCQTNVTWSGSAATCALKDCGALTAPANGSVSQPNTLVGGVATYSCNANYNLSGAATRTCQTAGSWSGNAATCVAKTGNGGSCTSSPECLSSNCSIAPVSGSGLCCQSGFANCGSCVNKLTDVNNCGACSNKCALNRNCQGGACTCPGYTFPGACGGCGSWTFEANGTDEWAIDTNPALISGSNGAQNVGFTATAANVHDGGGALAVPINVSGSSSSLASVAVPFCQNGATSNLGGFSVSFWVKFVGVEFNQSSDDVFLFVGGWSSTSSSSGPGLFKNKMPVNTWINVNYTFPVSVTADHLSINLHPGGQWQGSMYIDSVVITGL